MTEGTIIKNNGKQIHVLVNNNKLTNSQINNNRITLSLTAPITIIHYNTQPLML